MFSSSAGVRAVACGSCCAGRARRKANRHFKHASQGLVRIEALEVRSLLSVSLPTVLASADVPKAAADAGSAISTLNVPDGAVVGRLTDVNVRVDVTQNVMWGDSLALTLISPQGLRVNLIQMADTYYVTSINNVRFDDQATRSISYSFASTFSGDYRPSDPLAFLNGASPSGLWRLQVDDSPNGYAGAPHDQ